MKRREFVTLLGGAAAWPFAAHAQQPAMPTVGYLSNRSPDYERFLLAEFQRGLAEAGYTEGRNVLVEYRWTNGQYADLPAVAADLVQRRMTVIVATGPAAAVAKAATTTIPIVFQIGIDPVAAGLVASLNRPGGNVTGVTTMSTELGPKRLELLRELLPTGSDIALLVNPAAPTTQAQSQELQAAARKLGLQLHILNASTERDLDAVFESLVQLHVGGLVIGVDPLFSDKTERLATLALRRGVPSIHSIREFAAAGGLMAYGSSNTDNYRLAGVYTGRILKGEKPADLPVQQATKLELILNLKTAKALGLTVPLSLLARADEVIE
jgi:putative tryptophan/tyrosine transport system substrate-binding protein